jgi:hypothetical protein
MQISDFKTTPDLSQEFNPIPKTYKAKKISRPLNKIGKRTRESLDNVEQRKKEFAMAGITTCEARLKPCWRNNALGFAHEAKRRKLTKEDLKKVILICNPCHGEIEVWPAEEMKQFVNNVIANREKQP